LSNGKPSPKELNFSILRDKKGNSKLQMGGGKAKKNAALAAWATADLRHLLTAPIWRGCAGLWERFEAGTNIYHDAWYWASLILVLTGCRSDEGCGLALSDIMDGAPAPYLHIRPNALRRIKTAASNRKVPIHPRLVELGFLDYVKEMRALGHEALFPELRHQELGFDHNFYDKIFEPLRAYMFPNGTGRKKGRKDVDVRSIRSRCVSHLRDVGCPKHLAQAIVGHEVGDVTSDIYEEDPDPALLLPWVKKLGELLPDMPCHPLNLRPAEWQKFGAPRGRPRLR
jgi:integrase